VQQIKLSTEMTAYLLATWLLVTQVADMARILARQGETTQEIVSLITSLTADQASFERLLALVCGHWHIENRLHYVRDVDFGEDRSRLRSGNAPQVMAAVRNLVITLIYRSGSSEIAAFRHSFAYILNKLSPFCLPKWSTAIIH
jgi:predicted transposase YbfD/YdcC